MLCLEMGQPRAAEALVKVIRQRDDIYRGAEHGIESIVRSISQRGVQTSEWAKVSFGPISQRKIAALGSSADDQGIDLPLERADRVIDQPPAANDKLAFVAPKPRGLSAGEDSAEDWHQKRKVWTCSPADRRPEPAGMRTRRLAWASVDCMEADCRSITATVPS